VPGPASTTQPEVPVVTIKASSPLEAPAGAQLAQASVG
jgi:hypothetical protein